MEHGLIRWPVIAGLLYIVSGHALAQSFVPASISVQGRLTTRAGTPVPDTSAQALTFRLYSAATGGTLLWSQAQGNVAVSKGAFSATLNLATGFTGANTLDSVIAAKPFLEITAGTDPPMTPRLPFSSGAYALRAKVAESLPAGALNGTAWLLGGNSGTNAATQFIGTTDNRPLALKSNGRRVLQLRDAVNAAGTVRSVNTLGGAEANLMAAGVVGGTIAGGGAAGAINDLRGDFGVIGGGSGNFLDAFPHAVIAGGTGNIAQGTASTIGGGSGNGVQAEYGGIMGGSQNFVSGEYAIIGGGLTNQAGGSHSFVGGGAMNQASAPHTVVGGGSENQAYVAHAVVGGGFQNRAGAASSSVGGGSGNSVTGELSTIGGGSRNVIAQAYATIGGGVDNQATNAASTIGGGSSNKALGLAATIGGGNANTAGSATGSDATVAGGQGNQATGEDSAVGGGWLNRASGRQSVVAGGTENVASGPLSTVGGGWKNTATGQEATVPGGYYNFAGGRTSFAAGYRAVAGHGGAFVWSDASSDTDFTSSATHQFAIRAGGGIVLETGQNAFLFTSSTLGEKNRYLMLLNSPQSASASGLKAGGILCADSFDYFNPGKNDMVVKGRVSVGYNFVPQNYTMSVNGSVYALNGYAGSDARWKTNIRTLPNALPTVLDLRGVSFDWRKDEYPDRNFPAGTQVGLIAQEVEKALPEIVSADDEGYKSVSYQSLVPVLVEAVKEQQRQIEEKDARLTALEGELERQRLEAAKARVDFEARLRRLEESASGGR